MDFNRTILDLNAPIVFFPVRHHSPVGARLLQQLVMQLQPAAILIEGPADFNANLDQLSLPHQLPIAIYSYAHLSDGSRRSAFYPYCDYSPEWQALQLAASLEIPAQFIDLPWAELAATATSNHRYAETELHQSRYVQALGEQLGIEGLDDLWDHLFEIDPSLDLQTYLERCHQFCFRCRLLDGCFSEVDYHREAFMKRQIQAAREQYSGQLLVVTGGYHSYALHARLSDQPFPEPPPLPSIPSSTTEWLEQTVGLQLPGPELAIQQQGSALTPFSYERLDSLQGYDAGMPSPGFYDQVWRTRALSSADSVTQQSHQSRQQPLSEQLSEQPSVQQALPNPPSPPYRQLLLQVLSALRAQNQIISTADLIAVETMAQGLADLRGHCEIWRQDLLDAITGALIKEPLDPHCPHPFLVAVQQVFQGQLQGQLSRGTDLPPLTRHLKALLAEFDLMPQRQGRLLELNLRHPHQRQRIQILYQLRALGIAGYDLLEPCAWNADTEILNLQEGWAIRWSPEFEASCIENAVYGCTLAEAAAARLQDIAQRASADAAQATRLLLDSFLMGLPQLTMQFYQTLTDLIQTDNNFLTVAQALEPLLFLYCYDDVLGMANQREIGALVASAFQRALWLLDNIGSAQGNSSELLRGVKAILNVFERCHRTLELSRESLVQAHRQISHNLQNPPLLRGAALGTLWRLSEASTTEVSQDLMGVATASQLGDFLTGLFYIAREVAQHNADLLVQIDGVIQQFDEDLFLEALPALHLAFTYFTPREKHEISQGLMQCWEGHNSKDLLRQPPIAPELIAQAQAMEANVLSILGRYGLRGSPGGIPQNMPQNMPPKSSDPRLGGE